MKKIIGILGVFLLIAAGAAPLSDSDPTIP
ncbi:MAG: lipoprotein [Candidatus Sungbacteria bacterium]|nr:lipoprotein [Candidatus Sungbacteria bacterium]